jgi:hypothetical protein
VCRYFVFFLFHYFISIVSFSTSLTPLQAIHCDKIQGNTGIYFLVDDIEYGKSIVDMWI